jgi:hypothetical protein
MCPAEAGTVSSEAVAEQYSSTSDNTRDIAIAALSMACISLLLLPVLSYFIAKRLVRKSTQQDKMKLFDESRRNSVASSAQMNGYQPPVAESGARIV